MTTSANDPSAGAGNAERIARLKQKYDAAAIDNGMRLRPDDFLDEATFEACWNTASAALDARPAVQRFCASFVDTTFQCGFEDTLESCQQSFGMWRDGVVDRLARCPRERDCDAFSSCIDRVFDGL